jgi:hypothetical protein
MLYIIMFCHFHEHMKRCNLLDATHFKREYIGSVFNILSPGAYDDKIYVLKHFEPEVSILSHSFFFSSIIPYVLIQKQTGYITHNGEIQIYTGSLRKTIVRNSLLVSFHLFSESEWIYLRHSANYLGFSISVVHGNSNAQLLRNLANFDGVSNVLQGHTMVFSQNYCNISSCNIIKSLFLLHVFFSRSRTDENQYSQDVAYINNMDELVPIDTVDLFFSCLDNIALEHEYESHIDIEEQLTIGCYIYDNSMYSINQLCLLLDNSYITIFENMDTFFLSFVSYMLLWQIMYVFYISAHVCMYNIIIRLVYSKVLYF